MKIGTRARQIVPVIQGVIADKRFNREADCLEYLIAYTDDKGEVHQVWLKESELTPVRDVEVTA